MRSSSTRSKLNLPIVNSEAYVTELNMRLLIKLLILNDFNLRIYNIFEANDLNTNDKTQLKF
jgi:hypothetical protein